MHIQKFNHPWAYWIIDDFLSADCLAELKSVPVAVAQSTLGRRVGSERLFIDSQHCDQYPKLHQLWENLHSQDWCDFFKSLTGIDYSSLHPRLEVISDWGDFYLAPHGDHLEKRLNEAIN